MGYQTAEMTTPDRPRILFLDAYDSFTNNITSLLTVLLDVDVYVLPIDAPLSSAEFQAEAARYDALVCGPGPGRPDAEKDVGLMRLAWDQDVPVLGVCLGFQSLAVATCGGCVQRLRRGLHGMVREVRHVDGDVFKDVGGFRATLYHSLGVAVSGEELPGLEQLAWVDEEREDGGGVDTILMAVKHRTKPYWGLQYHPESVCTDAEGNRVIANWFELAMGWNQEHGRVVQHGVERVARKATRESLLSRVPPGELNELAPRDFQSSTLPLPSHVQVPDIVELLDGHASEHVVLDSANAMLPTPAEGAADVRGRYSIIGLELASAARVEYRTGDEYVTVRSPVDGHDSHGRSERIDLGRYGGIWNFLAAYQHRRRVDPRDGAETPFLGGFIGYVTYEQGLRDIGVEIPSDRGHRRPDVCLVWVTRSVVVDHRERVVHVQELAGGNDGSWIQRTATRLRRSWASPACSDAVNTTNTKNGVQPCPLARNSIQSPIATDYEAKVRQCQDYIAAGDSYELCLTDQTTITRPRSLSSTLDRAPQTSSPSSWQLFRTLRARQPAPFASYLRLGPATLVSASPERFLFHDSAGHVSMRPMKGTVRKSVSVSTLAQAEAILHVPKEEAENLMIVDLVRHDLHGVCGAGGVQVRELMKVEEYESVFQMITAVEGRLPAEGAYTGLDVLAASLPPGSMTGAPKKRSCEILRGLEEGKERGLYSGVVGYMCASGRGDWSVTIRSLFRWDDEGPEEEEVWRIGAGGAVTILSTPKGEAEEMFTKLAGPLGVFGDSI